MSRPTVSPACRLVPKTKDHCAFCGRAFIGALAHRQHYDSAEACGRCCGCLKFYDRNEKESRAKKR